MTNTQAQTKYTTRTGNHLTDIIKAGKFIGSFHKEEDAAFIVRACNSHDALLAALECSRAMDLLNCEGTADDTRKYALEVLAKHGFDNKDGGITYQQFVCEMTDAAIQASQA